MKTLPHLDEECSLWEQGFLVCGIDEVGRGSFAGPLVTAGVILKPILQDNKKDLKNLLSLGINDSKLLSKKKREVIKKITQEYILFSVIQYIEISLINEKGIGFANKMGFSKIAEKVQKINLPQEIFYLTDAFKINGVDYSRQKDIIRGDATSISIALASIIAKVERDSYMERLAVKHPEYGFEKHKGYGTATHREQLKLHGATPHHRIEFIKNYIESTPTKLVT